MPPYVLRVFNSSATKSESSFIIPRSRKINSIEGNSRRRKKNVDLILSPLQVSKSFVLFSIRLKIILSEVFEVADSGTSKSIPPGILFG